MNKILAAIALALSACGGGTDTIPLPAAHASAPPPVEVAHLHAILRPDSAGRWFIQNDVDHMPIGVLMQVEQTPEFVRIFFDRNYTHAGVIQITSDDDFRGTIAGHSNLGLNAATIRITANGRPIDPAAVYAFVPPGAGNLWISVTMVNRAEN